MRRIFFALSILILLGCNQSIPNPLIGSYTMPAYSNPVLDNGALSLKSDGTFIYVELISSSSQYQVRIDGTYDISLYSYDFVSADGSIVFTVPDGEIPDAISGLLMKEGKNTFLFDWSCDRDLGPVSLTLVLDADDSSKNFEFEYMGSADKLDSVQSILPEEISGESGDEETGNPGEETGEEPSEDTEETEEPDSSEDGDATEESGI